MLLPRLFLVALCLTPLTAQTTAGTVVNAKTGEPIKGAMVTLQCYSGNSEPKPLTTFTDSTGGFRFATANSDACHIMAQKPGFARASSRAANLRIALTPFGVITGRVTDADRQPVARATVLVIAAQILDGDRELQVRRTVTSDDRGVYRTWNLDAGKYYVKVAGRSGGTNMLVAEALPRYLEEETVTPAYFGGGASLDSATPVGLEAGEEAKADLRVNWRSGFRISGRLEGFAPRPAVKFELSAGEEPAVVARGSVSGDGATFEVYDVVPGSYLLRATQADTVAEREVVVKDSNLRGVVLAPASPVEIEVVERQVNPSERMTRYGFLGCSVSLRPIGRPPDRPEPQHIPRRAAGPGTITGVRPGRYRVRFNCGDAYVRSAVAGTQDLLVDPVLTVAPGVAPPTVEIVSSGDVGTIAVTVEGDRPNDPVGVLLVPQSSASVGPVGQSAFGGRVVFPVAPGVYLVYAVPSINKLEYRNPEVLKNLTGGIAVQVAEGQSTSVTLRRPQ